MAWTKAKTAIVAGAGLLLVAGTTTITVKEIEKHRTLVWQENRTPVWQEKFDLSLLDRLPPQVKILPSLPSTLQSGVQAFAARNGKALGLGENVPVLLMLAYNVSRAQLIWNTPIPEGKYDFIANLPNPQDNIKAGQDEIKNIFGLTIRRETVETNALVLVVRSRNKPGLHPATGEVSWNEQAGSFSAHGHSLWYLRDYLERCLGTVVVDRTQLTGRYDIDFKWDSTPEGLKQAMIDQLGLELVPSREPVEMLVVEKAK